MTLTILWYALAGHHRDVVAEHRARAPWYLSKDLGDEDTRPEFVRLRAASQSAELDVEEISLTGRSPLGAGQRDQPRGGHRAPALLLR